MGGEGSNFQRFAFRAIPMRSICPYFIGIVATTHLILPLIRVIRCVGDGVGKPKDEWHRSGGMRHYPSWKDLQRITKRGRYSCGHGCYMQIAEGGSRAWLFRYRTGNKGYHIGLGSCEYVTLAEARDKAIEYRRMLAAGRDPMTEKRGAKRERLLATAHAKTFKEC